MTSGRYRFIGSDGSLGYRTGWIYRLSIRPMLLPGEFSAALSIERRGWQRWLFGPGYCPYMNKENFYKNWEEVIV